MSTIDCAPVRFAALRRGATRTLAGAAALLLGLLGLVASLGVFRASGTITAWLEETPIGRIAKEGGRVLEPARDELPLMGTPIHEPFELGEAVEPIHGE